MHSHPRIWKKCSALPAMESLYSTVQDRCMLRHSFILHGRKFVCLKREHSKSSQSKIHRFFPAVAEIKFVFQLQNPHSPCLHPHPLSLAPPPPPSLGEGGVRAVPSAHNACLLFRCTEAWCGSGADQLQPVLQAPVPLHHGCRPFSSLCRGRSVNFFVAAFMLM